jgi:hypothetical protein
MVFKKRKWGGGGMINKIKKLLNKNACSECNYYNPDTKVCQSKKVQTYGCHPYVNWFDRKFCKPYKVDGGMK